MSQDEYMVGLLSQAFEKCCHQLSSTPPEVYAQAANYESFEGRSNVSAFDSRLRAKTCCFQMNSFRKHIREENTAKNRNGLEENTLCYCVALE